MDSGVTLDPTILAIVLGSGLPIIVRFVTKEVASSRLRAIALAFLSTATGVLSTAQTHNGFISKETLVFAAVAWVVAVASYYGFHAPAGVTDWVGEKTSGVGIGKAPEE